MRAEIAWYLTQSFRKASNVASGVSTRCAARRPVQRRFAAASEASSAFDVPEAVEQRPGLLVRLRGREDEAEVARAARRNLDRDP
ncbi:MAG: hypothetical protein IPL90_02555 [Holophagales bacterium]|nr:hypothetical protein [Holophagales bacterium]